VIEETIQDSIFFGNNSNVQNKLNNNER